MTISIGNCRFTEAAFSCVLTEGLEYKTLQEAFNAYRLCVIMRDSTLAELGIKLSGLTLPRALSEAPGSHTGYDLVEAVDNLVGTIALGIRCFAENLDTTERLIDEKGAEDYALRYFLGKANSCSARALCADRQIA